MGRGSVGREILCFLVAGEDCSPPPLGSPEDDEGDVVAGILPVDALRVNHFVGLLRNWVKDGDADRIPGDPGGILGLRESLVDSEFIVAFLFGAIFVFVFWSLPSRVRYLRKSSRRVV